MSADGEQWWQRKVPICTPYFWLPIGIWAGIFIIWVTCIELRIRRTLHPLALFHRQVEAASSANKRGERIHIKTQIAIREHEKHSSGSDSGSDNRNRNRRNLKPGGGDRLMLEHPTPDTLHPSDPILSNKGYYSQAMNIVNHGTGVSGETLRASIAPRPPPYRQFRPTFPLPPAGDLRPPTKLSSGPKRTTANVTLSKSGSDATGPDWHRQPKSFTDMFTAEEKTAMGYTGEESER
ncbi:hypothetical protein T439DRAFT_376922 [Meredithblackwellia eburnea MCA 4105]